MQFDNISNFPMFVFFSFFSVAHPKAGTGASVGAWTNTGSLSQATMTSRARQSAITWRVNEGRTDETTHGWRERGDGEREENSTKKLKKEMERKK